MSKNLRDALDDAYDEPHGRDPHGLEPHGVDPHGLQPKPNTHDVLRKAMREKRERRPMVLVRMLRYRMPAYQTLALACILLAVIAWLYAGKADATKERIVYMQTNESAGMDPSSNAGGVSHQPSNVADGTRLKSDSRGMDTDAFVRRVVDSVRNELRRESVQTRRSLKDVSEKLKYVQTQPLLSPLQNDGAVGLENLTQLQYQQRGRSLADHALSERFNDTVMSEQLR